MAVGMIFGYQSPTFFNHSSGRDVPMDAALRGDFEIHEEVGLSHRGTPVIIHFLLWIFHKINHPAIRGPP